MDKVAFPIVLGLALACFAAAPAPAAPPPSWTGPAADAVSSLAWTQRSVPVGRMSGMDRWRCQHRVNGVLYFATDRTERGAREKLRPYTNAYVYCRPLERMFPFGGF